MSVPRLTACVSLIALSMVAVAVGAAPTEGASAGSGAKVRSVVIDTDMTVDDWMAILFLVNRTDVRVKAITVSGTGVAHGAPGARNAIRLLDLAGEKDIPVAYGRAATYSGGHAFPALWRRASDDLLDVPLPAPSRAASKLGAARQMLDVVKKEKVEILSLGPLTNIADTLRKSPTFASRVSGITVMGGALSVAGNGPGSKAEWNFYVDPRATDIVLRSGIPWTLVPLDATNAVPYNDPFFKRLGANATTASARFVHEVLSRQVGLEEQYFWDPLGAAVLVDPSVAMLGRRTVRVVTSGAGAGRTVVAAKGTRIRAALRGNKARFEDLFLATLNASAN
jgi:inosine-uridine nucleoside N-ribohydrolase